MIAPPSEDDKRHAAANYLHFEHDNPATCDVYFESFEEAVGFINDRGWSFSSEDWEPYGHSLKAAHTVVRILRRRVSADRILPPSLKECGRPFPTCL